MSIHDGTSTAPQSESPDAQNTRSVQRITSRRRRLRLPHMPARYGLIALGSGLLIMASATSVPLGPHASTAWRELFTLVTGIGGLALTFRASLPIDLPAWWLRWYVQGRWLALAVALLLTVGTLLTSAGATYLTLRAPAADTYTTDIMAFTDTNARLTLAGRNPYTSDDAFREALARFPFAAGSPQRGNTFGTGFEYPAPLEIYTVQSQYARDPGSVADAFDPATLHSYPALSFLVYVPLIWAGGGNILLLDIAVYWALFAWLVWLAPVGWRHWAALIGLAAMPVIAASLMETIDIIGFALVLTTWRFRDRFWLSCVLFGLALAFKQNTWFYIPFFTIELLSVYGWREVARRAALVLGVFLLPNLPFILASPRAWFLSLWLPMSEPLFPMGIGIITLSIGHIIPFAPPLAYALAEVAAMGVVIWVYARWRPRIGDGVLILALLPLFFAFRSSPSYFAFVPWLALYAVNQYYAQRIRPQPSPVVAAATHIARWLSSRRQALRGAPE